MVTHADRCEWKCALLTKQSMTRLMTNVFSNIAAVAKVTYVHVFCRHKALLSGGNTKTLLLPNGLGIKDYRIRTR